MGVDLNLVPFIDFLSCLIAFLMIAAVWTQIHQLEIEQSIAPPDPNAPPPPVEPTPPLTIGIRADHYWVARKTAEAITVPKVGEAYDYAKLEELLNTDRATLPTEEMIIINTDDGVPYEEMVKVLDMSRKTEASGRPRYPKVLLAGQAPTAVLPPDAIRPAAAGG